MFRIKICGVTSESDVDAVAKSGADAIGLNFHRPSIRFVDASVAGRLSTIAERNDLMRVGVFVDQSADEIAKIADNAQLDGVQLHGNQSVAEAAWLQAGGWHVIRVLRLPVGPLEVEAVWSAIEPWKSGEFSLLLDADAGMHGGGMGLRLDWDAIGKWATSRTFSENLRQTGGIPPVRWALAGGLTSETVGQAIASSHATSIDVASGVEEPRGKKCRRKIEGFVAAAFAAWRNSVPS
jgi:phosphoribosylanthranilate isomerase